LNGRRVRKTKQCGMSHLGELPANSLINARMPMSMDVHPDRCGGIEIGIAVHIIDIGAMSAFDNERGVPFPFLHLCKGMPYIPAIVFF
jgi:hypothetical protein